MKLFQSLSRILAARILAIEPVQHQPAQTAAAAAAQQALPSHALRTDAETMHVGAEWMANHRPEVGGFIVMNEQQQASYAPAHAIMTGFICIGEVDLAGQQAPQGTNAPEAAPAPAEAPQAPAAPVPAVRGARTKAAARKPSTRARKG